MLQGERGASSTTYKEHHRVRRFSYYSHLWVINAGARHGMRLACSGLPIRQQAAIVPIEHICKHTNQLPQLARVSTKASVTSQTKCQHQPCTMCFAEKLYTSSCDALVVNTRSEAPQQFSVCELRQSEQTKQNKTRTRRGQILYQRKSDTKSHQLAVYSSHTRVCEVVRMCMPLFATTRSSTGTNLEMHRVLVVLIELCHKTETTTTTTAPNTAVW